MHQSLCLQCLNSTVSLYPRFLASVAILQSISDSRKHWVNTQRHNVFPLNENHAKSLMKRMRCIDWADTNTSSQTHIKMLNLINWIGPIDWSFEGDSWEIVSFFLCQLNRTAPLLIGVITLPAHIDLQRATMQRLKSCQAVLCVYPCRALFYADTHHACILSAITLNNMQTALKATHRFGLVRQISWWE